MSLQTHRITAGHHGGEPVLTDVSLTVPAGSITGLTGASGSGKTTLARVLAGLHTPQHGHITLDDKPLSVAVPGTVAMLFQSPRQAVTARWTLCRIITEPLRTRRGRADTVHAAVQRVGLTDDLLDRRPHEVSDGQLQRACLARALVQRPRYLICDEMTAMLDPATAAALTAIITEETRRGLGVLAISHQHALLATWTDHTHVLMGQHVAGSPRGSQSTTKTFGYRPRAVLHARKANHHHGLLVAKVGADPPPVGEPGGRR